jgi:hypothetical protein
MPQPEVKARIRGDNAMIKLLGPRLKLKWWNYNAELSGHISLMPYKYDANCIAHLFGYLYLTSEESLS